MRQPVHILVVDDDASVRSVLRRGLEEQGFLVSEARDLVQLRQELDQAPTISLITLDLKLGAENGLQMARQIRATRNVPIIMITALAEPMDRVIGLEHGADDYIVKPFLMREVAMRVRTVLRRYELEGSLEEAAGEPAERYRFDAGILDVRRRELRDAGGAPVALTDAEFDILALFLRNPGRVMSRDDLVQMLRGRKWSPMDRTIDGHIARLRKKIEPDLERPTLIKTVWRVGYVFAGDVSPQA